MTPLPAGATLAFPQAQDAQTARFDAWSGGASASSIRAYVTPLYAATIEGNFLG